MMKYYLLFVFCFITFGLLHTTRVVAQTTTSPSLKTHVCVKQCMNGTHAYQQGEIGYINDLSVRKEEQNAPHVCTALCTKEKKHVYAHGEIHHVCTEACRNEK